MQYLVGVPAALVTAAGAVIAAWILARSHRLREETRRLMASENRPLTIRREHLRMICCVKLPK
jgi:hypothetical protein